MAHDPPKRLGADLEHLCCVFGGKNFHCKKSTAFGCSLGKPLVKPVTSFPRPLIPNAEKLVIVADVASQLSGVVSMRNHHCFAKIFFLLRFQLFLTLLLGYQRDSIGFLHVDLRDERIAVLDSSLFVRFS